MRLQSQLQNPSEMGPLEKTTLPRPPWAGSSWEIGHRRLSSSESDAEFSPGMRRPVRKQSRGPDVPPSP